MKNLSITEDVPTNFFSVSWNTEDNSVGFIFTRYEDGEITFWKGYQENIPDEYITTHPNLSQMEKICSKLNSLHFKMSMILC